MKLSNALLGIAAILSSTIPAVGKPAAAHKSLPLARSGTKPGSQSHARPVLEMVFVIDTTGSMGGLLDGARQRIWGIINNVQKANPAPKVRVGLVAFRDHGDEYVTKVTPISANLDKVYATLIGYQADGGGDTPEDVRQALSDGVHKAGWSPHSSGITQILFLVGDAPPHDDYANEPSTAHTTDEAVRAGITVNTIECGDAADTRAVWQSIARRGEGEFFAIAQDGGVQAVSTPFDKQLVDLGGALDGTYTPYGGGAGAPGRRYRVEAGAAHASEDALFADAAPMAAQADRSVNKAINSEAYSHDLMQSLENGTIKLDQIKKDDLPANLQKLSPADQKKFIEKRLADRKALHEKILAVSKQRDRYLADHHAKTAGGAASSFDAAVSSALRREMTRK